MQPRPQNIIKEQPCYEPSGALYEDEKVRGSSIKYSEPQDAAQPKKSWRLYVFNGDECIDTQYIDTFSFYTIGRDTSSVDIATDHPSCSKHHAVIQHRKRPTEDQPDAVKPYIIDLESTNGTELNGETIEPSRFYEILENDCIRFGKDSIEYVVLCDEK